MHRRFRETLLIGLASVYFGLLQQTPTEDSLQLMQSRRYLQRSKIKTELRIIKKVHRLSKLHRIL
jgi:hypothetical protein